MLQTSKQKRIFDYALKRGHLDKGFRSLEASCNLTSGATEFLEAYKDNDMAKMLFLYCDYIFWLRIEQAKLICTEFNEESQRYKAALDMINGATNQGFMMLEFISKVLPIGAVDIETAMDIVITSYENKTPDSIAIEHIRELLFGTDIEAEE